MRTQIVFQVLLVTFCIASNSFAETTTPLSLKGKVAKVSLDSTTSRTATFYGVSTGNLSTSLRLSVFAPAGSKVSVFAGKTSNKKQGPKSYAVELLSEKDVGKLQSECVEHSQGDTAEGPEDGDRPEASSPVCDSLGSSAISALGTSLTAAYGGSWSPGQVCGFILKSYKGGDEGCEPADDPLCVLLAQVQQLLDERKTAQAISATQSSTQILQGVLRKDTCSDDKQYGVTVKVTLPKNYSGTANIRVIARERLNTFSMAATIKPTSDGRFAPQPILLMDMLSTCGQQVLVTKWSRTAPVEQHSVKVFDLISYNGHTLNRSPIGSVLTGGKATFTLHNGYDSYSVCFSLVRERQKVNGY